MHGQRAGTGGGVKLHDKGCAGASDSLQTELSASAAATCGNPRVNRYSLDQLGARALLTRRRA
jgi:hypothetical protein